MKLALNFPYEAGRMVLLLVGVKQNSIEPNNCSARILWRSVAWVVDGIDRACQPDLNAAEN